MRGLRALAWLACVAASANGPPKRNAVAKVAAERTSGATTAREVAARDAAAEMIKSRLTTQTTRPAFEQGYGRRLQSASCETYSISGSEHQTSKHGTYVANGKCEGRTLYECLDCSASDDQYLWYNLEFAKWYIGSAGCGESRAGLRSPASTFGDPGSVTQWTEWSGEEWVETSTISVRCLEFLKCDVTPGTFTADDETIRVAVKLWFDDRCKAIKKYGHISTWETGEVTDMSDLFCAKSWCNAAASSFNEDISAWDSSGITTIEDMFDGASAFDQDLGWCLNDGVNVKRAFEDTQCASTSCGASWGGCDIPSNGNVMANGKIRIAVEAWLSDATAAEATYGHISTWETGGVTDMSYLFCSDPCPGGGWCSDCNTAAASFNANITAWDTSGVTTMESMFRSALAFDQPIGDWRVDNVTFMDNMFHGASAFNQTIRDWMVDKVTSMAMMFMEASAFNQPIGDWLVDKVTDMNELFHRASSFNQPIGGWRVDQVKYMHKTFLGATAFDQPLGWCVRDEVDMRDAFACGVGCGDEAAKCEPLSCGVVQGACARASAEATCNTVEGNYCKLSDPELCSGGRVSFVEAPSNPFVSIENRYAVPLLADLDEGGNDNLLVGREDGTLAFYRHADSVYQLIDDEDPFKSVAVGGHATPALVDLDGDDLLDLVVGAQGGGLAFYANTGTAIAPVFTKVSDAVASCGDELVKAECPADSSEWRKNDFALPKCNLAACGELCEGDGECSTDNALDNCGMYYCEGTFSDTHRCDIYRKRCDDVRPGPFGAIGLTATFTAPAFADLDGDGLVDLVIGKATRGPLIYYKNVGSRTAAEFRAVPDGPFANVIVASFSKPTFYDFDNDGDQDLIVGDKLGDVLLYLNVGSRFDPSFLVIEGTFPWTHAVYAAPTFGVLNGVPSLVVGSPPGQLVVYSEAPMKLEFATIKGSSPFGGIVVSSKSKPAFVDIDGDGDLDLVVGDGDGPGTLGKLHYYRNVGTPTQPKFEKVDEESPFDAIAVSDVSGDGAYGYSAPTFVDLDNDGDQDLIVGDFYGKLFYYRNVGTPTQPSFERVGCVDDLRTTDSDGADCSVYDSYVCGGEWDDGDFTASEQCCACGGGLIKGVFDGINVGDYAAPTFVDLDNDEDLDLVVGVGCNSNPDCGKLIYYRNVGTPSRPSFEKVGCMDDLTITDSDGNDCSWYIPDDPDCGKYDDEDFTASEQCCGCGGGIGNSLFDGIDVQVDYIIGGYSAPTFIDLDDDGDLDLVLGGYDGALRYYRNVGTPSQPAFEKVDDMESPLEGIDVGSESAPTFADVDGDGDMDLVVGDTLGRLNYFQNADSCRQTSTDGGCSGNGICGAYQGGNATCECLFTFEGDQCDLCREGHIGLTCQPCEKHTFSTGGRPLAGEACEPCLPGKFSVAGAGSCDLCPAGQYRSAANVSVTGCHSCSSEDNTWSNEGTGQTCDLCRTGYYRDGAECKDCTEGMICETADVTIDNFKCIAGTYRVGDECENCKDGMVCKTSGVTLENVRLEKNRWRTSAESAKIETCPLKKSCRSTKRGPDANVSVTDGGDVGRRLEAAAEPANTTDAGEALCTKGHEGPLCAVCKRHYYRLGQECIKCRPSTIAFTVIGILVGIVIFLAFFLIAMNYSNLAKKVDKSFEKNEDETDITLSRHGSTYFARAGSSDRPDPTDAGSRLWRGLKQWLSEGDAGALRRNVTTFVKQLSGTYSIFVNLPWVFDIKFPNIYERVLERLAIVNVNMSFSLECVISRKVTFQDQLLAATIGPIVAILIVLVLGVLWLGFKRNELKHREDRKRTTIYVIAQLVLLILFLSYTSTSTIIFRAFRPCDHLGEEYHGSNRYMHDDYSVSCKSSRHVFIVTWAALMLLVYPIGIPLVSFVVMWRNREKLDPKVDPNFIDRDINFGTVGESDSAFRQACVKQKSELREKAIKAQDRELVSAAELFNFMYDNYEPKYWWFECFDYLRRLALTGLMVIILPGSALQGFIGVLIAFCGVLAYVHWKPFKEDASDWLGVSTQLTTFFVFLSVLMVQVNAVIHRSGFGVLLTVVTFIPPFVSLGAALREFNYLSPKKDPAVPGSNEDATSKAPAPAKDDVADPEASPTSPLARNAPPQVDEEAPAAPAMN